MTSNGKILASGNADDTVCLWSLPDGEHIKTLVGHTGSVPCLAISPDGRILASGSYDHTVRLWSLPSGEHIRTLKGHSNPVWRLRITPDGRKLVSGSHDNTMRLWRLPWNTPLAVVDAEDLGYVEEIIRVTEQEIINAMQLIWERMKIIVEPSSAVTLAAVLKSKQKFKNKKIGLLLSGGNVDLTNLPFTK